MKLGFKRFFASWWFTLMRLGVLCVAVYYSVMSNFQGTAFWSSTFIGLDGVRGLILGRPTKWENYDGE